MLGGSRDRKGVQGRMVHVRASQVGPVVKTPPANAEDMGSIPGSETYPLQYSCLENPMDREVWWTTVQRDPKSNPVAQDWSDSAHTDRYMYMYGWVTPAIHLKLSQNCLSVRLHIKLKTNKSIIVQNPIVSKW